jgi:hypothetical protein
MLLKPSLIMLVTLQLALPASTAFAQNPDAVAAPVAAPEGAAPASAPPTVKTAEGAAADRANEMVCRRRQETGSLVKAKKTCHTREQWAYIDAEQQRMGRDFVANAMGRPSGN